MMGACLLLAAPAWGATETISYNEHIRPILAENCFACHGRDESKREADRRLDTFDGATAERKGIQAIVPGRIDDSDAWLRITSTDDDERMPPTDSHKPPLTPKQTELIQRWIEQGAVYQQHWAYEPNTAPAVPSPALKSSQPIDRFVAAKLAPLGLKLAPEVAKEILLRRATLDLTGLPPTVAEIDAFLADKTPGAYERVIDRLLASAHYGEHIGRNWLDAVRYGDTHGLHFDNARTIWPYRDWVVAAFNANMPFDRFTIEQLAGDLLPQPTQSQLVATGYLRCHLSTNEGGAITEEVDMRYTNDRVDTTTAVWLGLTANCASCHDHKFDPLKQKEYYSLGAFFKGMSDGTWDANARVPGPFVVLAEADEKIRLDRIQRELPAMRATLAAKVEKLIAGTPIPKDGAASYEVIWAEDGDVPVPQHYSAKPPAAQPGSWVAGAEVPLAGGQRALRLEGAVERTIMFAAGDVPLAVAAGTKAFVYVNLDPERPPQAISVEFITAAEGAKRIVWGDAKAFGEAIAASAIAGGPRTLAGTYVRLEVDTAAAGLAAGAKFTGLRLAQTDGAAWWDHMGVSYMTPDVKKDPLLSVDAWAKLHWNEAVRDAAAIPLDVSYRLRLPDYFQTEDDRRVMSAYFAEFIYGPLRGALETDTHAVREVMAELVYFEQTRPVSLIAGERAEPIPAHVLIRGQYDKPGELVGPDTPAFLPPLRKTDGSRPTRMDLAQWLVSPENPLTARVAVNRLWQILFGEGLVRTPGDFGTQGDPPTHLDLHNWLAAEFIRSGWDTKQMLRMIMRSQTYRQDSKVSPAQLELDPFNRLLARGPRVRLQGEVLRDQALAVGGLLVPKLGGPPTRPYQPENIWEPVAINDSNTRFYVQDHGEALYRRSLYTIWKRTAPPPLLTTFDAPSRESFCLKRGGSDTPLQALALMNDVQLFEAARAFAERLLMAPGSDDQRLEQGFRSVTSRKPARAERSLLADALTAQRRHFAANPEAAKAVLSNGESKPNEALAPTELAAWTLVASLMLNLDEVVTNH